MSERCVPMIEVEGEPCEEHGWPMAGIAYGGLCIEGRLIKAEAQIQRVRDVCDLFQRRYDSSIRHPTDIPAVAIVAVRRALDGESPGVLEVRNIRNIATSKGPRWFA